MMSSSGNSTDVSYHRSDEPSTTPSHTYQNRFSGTETSNDGTWPQSHFLPIEARHSYRQADFINSPTSSMDLTLDLPPGTDRDYETWQPDLAEPDWDACSPTSYQLTLEEINKMDAYMLTDKVVSCGNSPGSLSDLPETAEGLEAQISYAAPQIPTSPCSPKCLLTPISPRLNEETSPETSKATLATKTMRRPIVNKSPDQTRTDHSVVEKKYRDNLNAKFWDLQQCVPTLPLGSGEPSGSRAPDAAISDPGKAAKLQKGEIISRAVDHIRTLSARTSGLETHIELLERRLTVLQRIALQKTKRVGIGLNPADIESDQVPVATKPMSPISPFAEVSPGGVSKASGEEPDQVVSEKTNKRPSSQSEREPVTSAVTHNELSPSKRRKISRDELAKVAMHSLVGLGFVGRVQSCWCPERPGTACLAT